MYYLRVSLKSEAKLWESSDDNFDSLFKALEDISKIKGLIVHFHLLAIVNYEKIHHQFAKELRSVVDCVKKNIRALKVLDYDKNKLSDILLVKIILQKLAMESKKQFEFSLKTSDVPQFYSLITFIEKKVRCWKALAVLQMLIKV